MSRLFDRLLARGSRPLTGYDLLREASRSRGGDWDAELRENAVQALTEQGNVPLIDRHIDGKIAQTIAGMKAHASLDRAPPGWDVLEKCYLLIGDEVGWYFDAQEGRMSDMLVAPIVPPFRQTFVDFRGVPNSFGVAEWGVHLSAVDYEDPNVVRALQRAHGRVLPDATPAPDDARWIVVGSVYVSWDGREVVGPVGTSQFFLRDEGSLYKVTLADDAAERTGMADWVVMEWTTGSDPAFAAKLVPGFDHAVQLRIQELLYAGLLAISFTHVKNVDVREVDPDPKLSRAFRKRNGRFLTRHYVLDIAPMKRYLEEDGHASVNGLAKAMHVCRGHFKTYTSERPLFGSVTGTFWWPSMARGSRSTGVVSKDYRVTTPDDDVVTVARSWVDDDEAVAPTEHEGGSNPDLSGRGWRAHAATLNGLARHLSAGGLVPLRARPDGPQFDCAWENGDEWVIAEVKSLTDANEAEQIRRGIGQCVDYRQAIGAATGGRVRAVLVLEREPSSRWLDVCAEAVIAVAWPGAFDRATRPGR